MPSASLSKRVFVQNHKCEYLLPLHVHFHANQAHFHKRGFSRGSFETEAQGNLEMAYLKWIIKYSLNSEMPATKQLRNTQ